MHKPTEKYFSFHITDLEMKSASNKLLTPMVWSSGGETIQENQAMSPYTEKWR